MAGKRGRIRETKNLEAAEVTEEQDAQLATMTPESTRELTIFRQDVVV